MKWDWMKDKANDAESRYHFNCHSSINTLKLHRRGQKWENKYTFIHVSAAYAFLVCPMRAKCPLDSSSLIWSPNNTCCNLLCSHYEVLH
jgi:hypothetical protein